MDSYNEYISSSRLLTYCYYSYTYDFYYCPEYTYCKKKYYSSYRKYSSYSYYDCYTSYSGEETSGVVTLVIILALIVVCVGGTIGIICYCTKRKRGGVINTVGHSGNIRSASIV